MKIFSPLLRTFTVAICLSVLPSQANTLYWDSDGDPTGNDVATGSGLGGSGNWDASSLLWFDLVNDVAWNNTNSDDAIITGAAGSIALAENINIRSLLFTNTSGFTISGSVFNFSTNAALIDTGTGDQTINSVIDGAGLTKLGTGALILGGANIYSNATTISEGTLRLGAAGVIPDLSSVTVATNATLDVASNEETIGSLAGAGNVLMSANLTVGSNNLNSTLSGIVDGTGSLMKIGTGTLTFSGTNLYTGNNIINVGKLSVGSDLNLGAVPSGTVSDAIQIGGNGTLRVAASFTLAPTRGVTLTETGAKVEVASGQTLTYAGSIAGTDVRLTKTGSGTLRETSLCSYSGLTIQSGTYRYSSEITIFTAGASGQLGAYPGTPVPDYIILDGATLRCDKTGVGSTMAGSNRGITITTNNGTINAASTTVGDVTIYNGIISGPGALTKSGANELRLKINNTFSKLTVTAGLLRINGTGGGETGFGAVPATFTPDAITVNGGAIGTSVGITLHTNRGVTLGANGGTFSLSAGLTIPSVITGAGNLIRGGGASSQVLTLSGANTYTGKIIINLGLLAVSSDTHLGLVPTNFVPDAITINGTNATFRSTATFTMSPNRGITIGPGDAIMEQTSGTLTYNGTITGSPTSGFFTKAGSATLRLGGTNANTYVAATRLSGGTLSLDKDNALGTGLLDIFGNGVSVRASTSTTRSLTNAIKYTASGFNFTGTGGLTFSGDVNLGTTPTAITNNNTAAAGITFSGLLTNVGDIVIETTNAQNAIIFTGDNPYTGATTVNGGRLFVSNLTGSGTGTGAVAANVNGTLGGSGTIAGAVTINSKIAPGGHLAGSSVGTLTLQNGLVMNSGTNVWELGALKDDSDGVAGVDFDQVSLTSGNLTMSAATISLNFTNSASAPDFSIPFWQTAHKWTVIKLNGGANPASANFSVVQTNIYYYAGAFTTAVEPDGSVSLIYTPAGPTAPIILTGPQNKTVIQTSNATFTVSATGTASLNYQWFFNNQPISFGTASTVTITNAQPANEGSYFVIVSNIQGSATSSVATLTVLIPPTITSQPQSQNVELGTNVTFAVTATGTDPLSYQWKFNGTNLSGATTNTFDIASVTTNDLGNYSVVITNLAGSITSSNAALTVGEIAGPVLSAALTNEIVTLSWTTVSGRVYRPQFKPDLNSTNWTDIPPDVTATGSNASITNSVSGQTQRYYRVVLLP